MSAATPPPSTAVLVPYGQGAARGLGVDEIGRHGAQFDRMVALGLPTVPGVTVVASSARLLTDGALAERAVQLLEELTGRRVVDPQRPILLRLSASAATEVAGLPADLTAIGLTVERAEHIGEIIGREDEAIPFYRSFVRALAEGA
ncbi:MAG: pyruvate, orthophosphate dikinase, partial [Pseudonocardiales bacterium]|nr:pyruvate, orthophosphate dikinase [Pseudonocardiales bacterium]